MAKDDKDSVEETEQTATAEEKTESSEKTPVEETEETEGSEDTSSEANAKGEGEKKEEEKEEEGEHSDEVAGENKEEEEGKMKKKPKKEKPKKEKSVHIPHKKKRGKKYKEAAGKFSHDKLHEIKEAIDLLEGTMTTKFDSSAEVHMNLGVDPKHADQMLRGTLTLPHGTGKDVKVIAFVDDDKIKACKAAGAIEAGSEDLVEKIAKGWMDFEVVVASPEQMKGLGKVAKTLGQKGLMPNPKAGTVSPDPAKTIEEIKKGRVEYKLDKEGNLHNIFGKVSFGADKLEENLKKYLKTIQEAKPSGVKGTYIKSVTVTTTMGPGIKIDPASIYA